MAISKIIYKEDSNDSGTTWMNVTDTTAAAADVADGTYFYNAAGVRTAGTGTGGGSGLPSVTSADTGKVLKVVPDITSPTANTILSQETLSLVQTEPYELTNANTSYFTAGKFVTLNIDGISVDNGSFTRMITIDPEEGTVGFRATDEDNEYQLYIYEQSLWLWTTCMDGSYTVSITVASYDDVDWSPSGGYDLAIKLNSSYLNEVTGGTVISGSPIAAAIALMSGQPISVGVFDGAMGYYPVFQITPSFDCLYIAIIVWYGAVDTFYASRTSGGAANYKMNSVPTNFRPFYITVNYDGSIFIDN